MKFNKKLLSIFLTVLMLVSSLGNSVLAFTQDLETNIESGKTPLEGRVEGDKKVFTLDLSKLTEKAESKNTKAMPARAPRRVPVQYDTEVNITATGLNGGAFNWEALPNKEFKLIARWKTKDGQTHTKTLGPFTEAKTYNLNVGWSVDGAMEGTADLETDFNQKVDIRVLAEKETSTGGSGKLVFDIKFTELAEPRAKVEYVDPYERPITDPADLPTGTMPKVTALELTDVEIDLPNSSKEINMRSNPDIDEDELNAAANGLTFKVDNKTTGETVTIDGKDYKLDISTANAKQIGTIKMIYQKDVIVPPTKPNSNDPVDVANGYFRLTFDANENKQDGIKGTHQAGAYAGQQLSYIDVRNDVKNPVKYDNANLQKEIKALLTTGTKEVNGKKKEYTQDTKNPWTPAVPTDTTPVTIATYNAQYAKSVAEQVAELGGLNPVTIKVWKEDKIDWADGVAPKTTNTDDSKLVQGLLDNAKVTDQSSRSSANSGKFEGKLKISFDDGSSLEVDKQMLIVSEHVVTVDPNNTDPDAPKVGDLPRDKITVIFKKGEGIANIDTKGKKTYAKPNATLADKDFPTNITYKDGYKNEVTWTPTDHKVDTSNSKYYNNKTNTFVFKASTKSTAEIVTELGGLKGVDFAAWVGDLEKLTDATAKSNFWKKGVEANTADAAKKATIDAALAEATVEDTTNPQKRTTAAKGEYPGTLKVTFKDGSIYEVTPAQGQKPADTNIAQTLYVYDKGDQKPDPKPGGEDKPVPEDTIFVVFTRDENTIKEDGFTGLKPLMYAEGDTVPAAKFPNAQPITAGETVKWTPAKTTALSTTDKAYDAQTKTFTFKASASKDVPITANKDKYDPIYQNGTGKPGDTVTIPAPKFKDDKGNIEDKKPVDNTTNPAKETTFAKNDTTQTNVTVDPNTGAISVEIPTTANVGDTITVPVDVIYPDNSRETVDVIVTVIDQENPTINQPYEGDKTINGKGEPGSEIKVELPDGTNVPGNVDENGNWTVDVPADKPLKPGDTIKATQTKNGKDKYATATVMSRQYYLTLTLDENYRGGRISDYDVYQGELIERYLYTPRRRGYVFEGWSYNSRRLDEVRPGDRIEYSTILYAIWSKQKPKDEEEVEPIDTREVGEHKAYMFGYTDGTVRPNGYITRAEAAALVTRLLGLDTFASAAEPAFTDTPSSWYNKAINAAVNRGIMKGYPDKSFRPNAPITRAEFTQMISTIDNKPYGVAPFADVVGHWAERPIGSEYQAGRIKGYPDGTFRPNAFITRAEAVVILNKIFERNYDAMSLKDAKNAYLIKGFIDLPTSFWGYYDMIEATNSHSFKRRVKGLIQEDWVEVK